MGQSHSILGCLKTVICFNNSTTISSELKGVGGRGSGAGVCQVFTFSKLQKAGSFWLWEMYPIYDRSLSLSLAQFCHYCKSPPVKADVKSLPSQTSSQCHKNKAKGRKKTSNSSEMQQPQEFSSQRVRKIIYTGGDLRLLSSMSVLQCTQHGPLLPCSSVTPLKTGEQCPPHWGAWVRHGKLTVVSRRPEASGARPCFHS